MPRRGHIKRKKLKPDHKYNSTLVSKFIMDTRTKWGNEYNFRVRGVREECFKQLAQNKILGLIADQNAARNGVFIDFFGKKAATTPSLATFFIRTGSPIIPIFCYPVSSHRYHIKIMDPVRISLTGNHTNDVLKITQLCTKIIEAQIRKNPSFWLWFHNRWRTQPKK